MFQNILFLLHFRKLKIIANNVISFNVGKVLAANRNIKSLFSQSKVSYENLYSENFRFGRTFYWLMNSSLEGMNLVSFFVQKTESGIAIYLFLCRFKDKVEPHRHNFFFLPHTYSAVELKCYNNKWWWFIRNFRPKVSL